MDNDPRIIVWDSPDRIRSDDSQSDCGSVDDSVSVVGWSPLVWPQSGTCRRMARCDQRLSCVLQPSGDDRCSRLPLHSVGDLFPEASDGVGRLAQYFVSQPLYQSGLVDQVQRLAAVGGRAFRRSCLADLPACW